MAYTHDQLVRYAEQAGFSTTFAPIMAAIAEAESSGNPDATHVNSNGSTDYGLWQINSVHANLLAGKNWHDPAANAQMAYAIYQQQGLSAWSTYTSGAYKRYTSATLPAGVVGIATSGAVGATGTAGTETEAFAGITSALNGIGQSFQGVAAFAGTLEKLSLPQTWVRIMAGVFGAGLVGYGVVLLTREVRN